jgi:peptide-methionine (R)-S-oxide reductase
MPAAFDLTPPSPAEFTTLTAALTPEERHVLLDHGTERAFCGTLLDNKKHGTYCCRVCGLPLFDSASKFDSGTGWPSFFREFARAHVRRIEDNSYGMRRVEIRCARCDSHLGHVFPDGPAPTRERHCLNSISLDFVERGEALPDRLGRGAPEGAPSA